MWRRLGDGFELLFYVESDLGETVLQRVSARVTVVPCVFLTRKGKPEEHGCVWVTGSRQGHLLATAGNSSEAWRGRGLQ